MTHFNYGLPDAKLDDAAQDACTGPRLIWPLRDIFQRSLGVSVEELIELSNDPRFRKAVIPSANLFATPNDICRFFELLVAGGEITPGRNLTRQRHDGLIVDDGTTDAASLALTG